MKYTVEGEIEIDVIIEVVANSEEDAYKVAKLSLKDYYRLDVYGKTSNAKFNLYAYPEQED